MNNYFANYKCWNAKKQRIAVFGRETGSGTIEIFELYCNKDDQFSKELAKTIYNNWMKYPELFIKEYAFHPKLQYKNIKQGDSAKFIFDEYCRNNFYHLYTKEVKYEETALYHLNKPKIVLKSKRLNKFSSYA